MLYDLSCIDRLTIFLTNIPDKKYVKKIKLWFNKILDVSSENFSKLIIIPISCKYNWEM